MAAGRSLRWLPRAALSDALLALAEAEVLCWPLVAERLQQRWREVAKRPLCKRWCGRLLDFALILAPRGKTVLAL